MHELNIARSILKTAAEECRGRPGSQIRKVGVRLGDLAGVDPSSLKFSLEAVAAEDTALAPLEVEIESCPSRYRCSACGRTFAAAEAAPACPHCGESGMEMVSGKELELAFVEMEEP